MEIPRYGTPNMEYIMSWLAREDDGPMWALNLMKYREVAEYADGRETSISDREADDRYAPTGPLATVGGGIVLVGQVSKQLQGDETEWDRVAIALYPKRTALIEMQQLPEFEDLHQHKAAGMDRTIVLASFPRRDTPAPDPPLSAAERGECLLLQVVADAAAPDIADDIESTRLGRFDIEGTIIGDDRTWAEARWNLISRATAEELAATQSIADDSCYALVLEPQLDQLAASIVAGGRIDWPTTD